MNKVVAVASIIVDDCFVVHDLRVVNGDKGLFVAMPSRKLPNGDFRDICHPINTEARNAIQDTVLAQFHAEGGVAAFEAAAQSAPEPALV
jgi:stage V sporulation protein G